jgi:hypothetical protein
MRPRRPRQHFLAGCLGPIARIGRCTLRLDADNRAPHASHKAKAIAADSLERGLVPVGRADPGARFSDDL